MTLPHPNFPQELKIVTTDSPKSSILMQKTDEIQDNEFPLALEIADKLFEAIQPYLPAAGLAAPQIGISKSIFIFSCDRDPKNLEVVINPTYVPIGNEKPSSWEGCFSVLLNKDEWKLANVSRFEKIHVTYLNKSGEFVEKKLEGFAAKVFQHECDHLQGIVNINRGDAEVKSFESEEDLYKFMEGVKKHDSQSYRKLKE